MTAQLISCFSYELGGNRGAAGIRSGPSTAQQKTEEGDEELLLHCDEKAQTYLVWR